MQYIILFDYQLLVIEDNDKFSLPRHADIAHIALSDLTTIYQSEHYYVGAYLTEPIKSDNNSQFNKLKLVNVKQVLNHFDIELINQIVYYQQLNSYYTKVKFCSSCSKKLTRQTSSKFLRCIHCEKEIYPQIAPCIIVRIHKENQILMARSPHFPPGAWGLIAGFVELGENLKQAVAREVMEEVGIKVKNIQYWDSQAWPFPTSTLMVGFTATYESGELVLQEEEIEAATWCDKDNLPGLPSSNYSISSRMINEFLHST